MGVLSSWLRTIFELGHPGGSILAEISMACLIGGLLTRLFEGLVNYHGVLKPIILGGLRLHTNVLLIMASNTGIIHATSCTVDDAWLRDSTIASEELLLVLHCVLRRDGLNI